ncbi:MAG TPA: Ig-like domain-containing protein [Blastocatellia bacterium]|nr:Ig-like domain-containing protein [Blastocatellia bacterium]
MKRQAHRSKLLFSALLAFTLLAGAVIAAKLLRHSQPETRIAGQQAAAGHARESQLPKPELHRRKRAGQKLRAEAADSQTDSAAETPERADRDEWRESEREHDREAYDQPDEAAKFYLRKRVPEGEKLIPVERYLAAREQARRMNRYATATGAVLPAQAEISEAAEQQDALGAWTPLGPGNIGGRTRAVVINPQNPNVMFAAGVTGGIWKTTNAGQSWTPLSDLLPNITISALAMDQKNPEVIYAGTGEGVTGDFRGAGIFKTADGGATWTQLPGTAETDFYFVNDLVISPANSQNLYAGTHTGVWRSTDGGANWTKVLPVTATGGCLDLVMRTDQATDYIFASCGTFQQATVYRNTDAAGAGTWDQVHSESGMGRTSLAIAPSNQNIIYAASASYSSGTYRHGLHAVFRSTSGGAAGTWTAQVRNSDLIKLNTALFSNTWIAFWTECGVGPGGFSSQGWYDNTLAVDPADSDRVWVGGIDLFRSDDGGRNWGLASHWWANGTISALAQQYAHADQHTIVFHPQYDGSSNKTMFVGSDGGIFRTDDARAATAKGTTAACSPGNSSVIWKPLNSNYGVTQFYHGAVYPDGKSYFGGTQDNGTLRGADATGINGWKEILGGDGGYVAVDPGNPQTLYAESTFLSLRKSLDGGASFSSVRFGIAESVFNFNFIAPFAMDPSDPQRLWIGGSRMWRTSNGAANWTPASVTLNLAGFELMSAVAVAPTDSNYVLAASDFGYIYRTDRALTAEATTVWDEVRPRTGYVSWLAFDPTNPNIAYATYSNFGDKHVWRSIDAGATWTAIDGTLPDLPVHCIVIDPNNTARLYIGTDLGVFVTTDGGANWMVENSGFANVVTEALAINTVGGVTNLYAFTHGRGVWRVTLGNNGCSYSLSATGQTISAAGGTGSVNVMASPGGCNWSASSNADWISITSGGSAVNYSVAPNPGGRARIGTVTIAGRSFAITQPGRPDQASPVIRITAPTTAGAYSTDNGSLILSGTASDDTGVTSVTWTSDRGSSGTATGTTAWKIGGLPLQAGLNRITVIASDASGNRSSAVIDVTFTPTTIITTMAGSGTAGFGGDGGPATEALLRYPSGIAVDSAGNIYIADTENFRIRKVTPDGRISSIGGTVSGSLDVAVDGAGNLYVPDDLNSQVLKIAPDGTHSFFAGNGTAGFSGDGGRATEAQLDTPSGVAVDRAGNVYIADRYNSRVRKVDPNGIITTFAGNGTFGQGGDGGPATAAQLYEPVGLAVDGAGNVYISDYFDKVRKVSAATGIITTAAGTGRYGFSGDGGPAAQAQLNSPFRVTVDAAGNLYIADTYNDRIRKVTPDGIINTIAGIGTTGFSGDGGSPVGAQLDSPYGVAFDSAGNLLIVDQGNSRVRRIVPLTSVDQTAPTIAITAPTNSGSYVSPSAALNLSGTAADNSSLAQLQWQNDRGGSGSEIVAVTWNINNIPLQPGLNNLTVRVWDLQGNSASARIAVTYTPTTIISRVAGTQSAGFDDESGTAALARLWNPEKVATDAAGNLYLTDTGNHRIRKVAPNGVITTVAGSGSVGASGDGGPATAASLNQPRGVAVDSAGNIYIADSGNHRIRKVAPNGVITTVAGDGADDFSGDGGPATTAKLSSPYGVAVDGAGNVYIADTGNSRIRKINITTGVISSLTNGGYGYSGDGGQAAAAKLSFPEAVFVDGAGNVYLSDTGNYRIRRIGADGIITTIAGTGTPGSVGEGGKATSAQINQPSGLTVDAAGVIHFADRGNHRIRRIAADGTITTVVGTGTAGANGENNSATAAQLRSPSGVATDPAGNLFIADTGNHRVLMIAPYRQATPVSAASYNGAALAPEAIAAVFGTNLATATQEAPGTPLPLALAGTVVRVRDSFGVERPAPLFFVSSGQINCQIPPGTAAGPATLIITNSSGVISTGSIQIAQTAPSLFTAASTGSGVAAALALRIKADGTQLYEPVARYDEAQKKFVAVPIDLSSASDQVFLVLFGTGLRGRSDLSAVSTRISDANVEVLYAGPQGGFVGLDQINLRLPQTLAGRGETDIVLTVDGQAANVVKISFK